MSARFTANFVVLLVGAGLLVALYAFSMPTTDWIALGAGSVTIVMALYSFAATDQGVYQRIADVLIGVLGTWAIVAARVMNYQGRWLVFGAAVGLAVLGAIGLLVRERTLGRGLQVGAALIGVDEFGRLAAVQRDAEAGR